MIDVKDISKAAGEIGTPLYIFDENELTDRINSIKSRLGEKIHLCYAIKANTFVVNSIKDCDITFEVCSPGEMEICEKVGVNPGKIVLSGVNKAYEHILYCMGKYDIYRYTAESVKQFNDINDCAEKCGKTANVLLRLSCGNQFGMNKTDIEDIIKNIKNHINVNVCGIQYYSGTQKKNAEIIIKEIDEIRDFINELKGKYGFEVLELEYGPGLFVDYFGGVSQQQKDEYLDIITEKLNSLTCDYRVTVEAGRYVAASCGSYISKIEDIKENDMKFCIIDGGTHQLNYYGQNLGMRIPSVFKMDESGNVSDGAADSENVEKWTICGSLCTAADVIAKNVPLSKPQIGDLLVFSDVGAYSVTEGRALFLSRDLPAVALYNHNKKIIVLREKILTNIFNI